MNLFWKEKLQEVVMEKWKVESVAKGLTHKKDYILFQNNLVKDMLKAETQEVKDLVDKHCNSPLKDEVDIMSYLLDGEADIDQEEKERQCHARKTQEYAIRICIGFRIHSHFIRAINNVQASLKEVAHHVEKVTGMKVLMLLGGPEPKRQGRLTTFTYVDLNFP